LNKAAAPSVMRKNGIHGTVRRALEIVAPFDIDARIVSYGRLSPALQKFGEDFQ